MRNQLREHTKASHERLDAFVGSVKPFESSDGYSCYLQGMYWLYEAYASAYDEASRSAGLTPVSAIHQANIIADMGRKPSVRLSPPACEHSLEEQIAVGYVLEGSAMGARYMIKTAKEADYATSYLSTLVDDSYQRWPRFVERLTEVESVANVDKTIEIAKQVFETAQHCFSDSATALGLNQ